jgi:glutamate synthase (NADPH/NADH) large chain
VTNPPLDAIREELVTSMSTALGPELNLLEPVPESCRMIKIGSPVFDQRRAGKTAASESAGLQDSHAADGIPRQRRRRRTASRDG